MGRGQIVIQSSLFTHNVPPIGRFGCKLSQGEMEIVNLNYLNLFKLPSPRGYSEHCPWNNRPQWSCDFCGLVEECLQRGFFFFFARHHKLSAVHHMLCDIFIRIHISDDAHPRFTSRDMQRVSPCVSICSRISTFISSSISVLDQSLCPE